MTSGFDLDSLREATSGALGSLISTTILYPLDTCKTKFQAEANVYPECRKYRNIADVLLEAIRTNKLLSLYQGLPTKNFQSVLAGFVYFYSYGLFKRLYLSKSGEKAMGTGVNLLVAAAAGACTAIVTQPLDTLSARMQTSEPGRAETVADTLRKKGLLSVFDGLGASLLLTCNPAIQYTVYEQLKARYLTQRAAARDRRREIQLRSSPADQVAVSTSTALPAFTAFALGALSKTVATVLTYPAIRCKVLMQRADTEEEARRRDKGDLTAGAPRSFLKAMQVIWTTEGLLGYYKGLDAQILKTVLAAALMLMIKEKVEEGATTMVSLIRLALVRADTKQKKILEKAVKLQQRVASAIDKTAVVAV